MNKYELKGFVSYCKQHEYPKKDKDGVVIEGSSYKISFNLGFKIGEKYNNLYCESWSKDIWDNLKDSMFVSLINYTPRTNSYTDPMTNQKKVFHYISVYELELLPTPNVVNEFKADNGFKIAVGANFSQETTSQTKIKEIEEENNKAVKEELLDWEVELEL